jgi:hypothetical protein
MCYKLFSIAVTSCFTVFVSCKKEPQKGEYQAVFTGKYIASDSTVMEYRTTYYYEATHSTKKELRLKEKQSQITSILKKHAHDSITGMLGFGSIFNPDENAASGFNTVSIRGKYDRSSIRGTFYTTFSDGKGEYLSEGRFEMKLYSQ